MREDLEAAGRRVLERLEEAGYVAYFVGGYVRDRLLGRPIHDIDIATSARPETVMALFPDSLPTGIRHGTVTVRMGDHAFEVTTFRVERGYSDARHPDEVVFVDRIEEDLARRDFTVNAMALDRRGRLVDPFGGREDLAARRIRCVGDPMRRFSEDGLRLVRAVRFAVQLDFAIEPRTWEALQACRETLSPVAHERIADELDKIMASPNPGRGFALLFESRLFAADDLAPYLAPPAWPDLAALAVPEG
ncbi:CCA tRNA nucleotidyltransferase, partial [Calditerricola satsumensis]